MNRLQASFLMLAALWCSVATAAPPALPATPAGAELLYARTFELDQSFDFQWRANGPAVTQGTLVVVSADPDLVYPRQSAEPVLYVGNQTAMRLNTGYPSGRIVALVPGTVEAGAQVWFGTPMLPEMVTAQTIAAEQALADENGISGLSEADIAEALGLGGAPLSKPDLNALLGDVAKLVRAYAPQEKEQAAALASQE